MRFRETRFSDVCGTTDEFTGLLQSEYEAVASDPEGKLNPLLEDSLYMVARMHERMAAYRELLDRVREIVASLEAVQEVDGDKSEEAGRFIRTCIASSEAFRGRGVEEIEEAMKEIRSVASQQENRLRQYKDLVLSLHDEFVRIKGGRPWLVEEADQASYIETLQRRYQAWLPSEPHRGHLLDWLARARAAISEVLLDDGQPVVQFEDGGSLPMSQVRYDPEVRNFHPASFKPGPVGRE